METDEDFELTKFDRVQIVRKVLSEYGQENFFVSFSGGKDSNVLSYLVDLAMPGNHIPRLYMDTGIELNAVRNFVKEKATEDYRIHIIQPQNNVKEILENFGYPFKSKDHSSKVKAYQKNGMSEYIRKYVDVKKGEFSCPKILRYQFTDENKLKISDDCCKYLKEKPLEQWGKKMNFKTAITGIRRAEGGRRHNAKCKVIGKNGVLKKFNPLAVVSDEWENWFIQKYDIRLPSVYYPPYNFDRTGCKGCPFNPTIKRELETMQKYFPQERKQCEAIWRPVYDEYRRLGYRLK